MTLQLKPNIIIGPNRPTFIIAEIGQNHQGDLALAKQLIRTAKECGADCVKFQKSCLPEKFTAAALKRPYLGENSWGATYGEHKAFLEFSQADFEHLQQYAASVDILFTASAMDPVSLELLHTLKVPFIKIGSGDSNNPILLHQAAQTHLPLVISTGMLADLHEIERIHHIVSQCHSNFALLHCVSAYPTPTSDLNLNVITTMIQRFPDTVIGYSGHEVGIVATLAARALGAHIVERHLTLDSRMKGSDHRCSLEPGQFKDMVDGVRLLDVALGDGVKTFASVEQSCRDKLGKCLVASRTLPRGHALVEGDVKIKVAVPRGMDGSCYGDVLGKRLRTRVEEDEAIQCDWLE